MDLSTPPSLQRLAMQSLLSNQSLAISALEDLPALLFPSLFLEAYATGLTEGLKAIVQAWPFYCLPLGDVKKSPDLNTFKAVLGGLDLLLAKKERSSHCKLQVLNLWKEHPGIWTLGYPTMAKISYLNDLTDNVRASCHSWKMEEHPLTIAFDLTINVHSQNELQTYLLQWAWARKERVQLCSRKLQIRSDCTCSILMALNVVKLDSIQELIVSELIYDGTMQKLGPFLCQMKNLQIFHICKVAVRLAKATHNTWYFSQFGAFLGQLQHLQELHVHSVFFIRGTFIAMVRSLTTLQTLSLSSCFLEEGDLSLLIRCNCSKKLKNLRLRNILMGKFSPEPLRSLLEHLAGSLQTLALEDCAINDGDLLVILPALIQCSKLRGFSFYGNHISMAALKMLLCHTAKMSHLRLGIYPAPQESYNDEDCFFWNINPERFARVCTLLIPVLKDMGITQKVQICAHYCDVRDICHFYRLLPHDSWVVTEECLPELSALAL